MIKRLEEMKEYKWDLYLNMFQVVELIDILEDNDDYYFQVRWDDWETFNISCIVWLIQLKDKIDDYNKLVNWWKMNVLYDLY